LCVYTFERATGLAPFPGIPSPCEPCKDWHALSLSLPRLSRGGGAGGGREREERAEDAKVMRADLRLRSRGGSVEENEGRGGGGGREREAEDVEGELMAQKTGSGG
jgi:hypothetical protein